jgi:hypothetical protein
VLHLVQTKVAALTPLQGLPLSFLFLASSGVSDLSPLRGMKELEHLNIGAAPSLTDLKPLQGLKVSSLTVYATRVENLSPLKGMPLKYLNIGHSRVKDLSPLTGMELETFIYDGGTPVKDIAVLKDMPLRWVLCDFRRERDEAVLRSIKTLETINRKPVAQFWKEVDGNNPAAESNAGRVEETATPPAKDGFVPLFNGKDFTGWRKFVDPQSNADPDMVWTVRDGVVVCAGRPNGYLITDKEYGNFVLRVQWR